MMPACFTYQIKEALGKYNAATFFQASNIVLFAYTASLIFAHKHLYANDCILLQKLVLHTTTEKNQMNAIIREMKGEYKRKVDSWAY